MLSSKIYKTVLLLLTVPFIANCGVRYEFSSQPSGDNNYKVCTLIGSVGFLSVNIDQNFTEHQYLAYSINNDEVIYDECVPGFVNEFDLFQANSLVVASDSLKLSVSEFSQTYRSYFNNNQKGGPASTEIDITIYGRSSCDAPLEAMETYNGKINWTNSQPNGPGCGGGSYVGSAEL